MSMVLKVKADGAPILYGIEHYWRVMRALGADGGAFTVRQIFDHSNCSSQSAIRDYLRRLIQAEYVEALGLATDDDGIERVSYRLLKRPRTAPSLRRDGSAGRQGRGQAQMWNAIRGLSTFTAQEIAVAATTDECVIAATTAKSYLLTLARAGYLSTAEPGGPNKPTVWRLKPSMNTGPLAPKILRAKLVWDANREKIMGDLLATQVAS